MNRTTYRQAAFSQADELDAINARPDRRGGVCHGLSMSWCNQYLLSPEAGPRVRVDRMRDTVRNAAAMQQVAHATWRDQGGNASTARVARFFNLRMATHHQIANSRVLTNLIRNETDTPMILSMSWERGGHSIALHRKRGGCFYTGRVRLFEPNFGEYRIRTCDFMPWYAGWLLPKYRNLGNLERIDVRTFARRAATAPVRGGVMVMPIAA